MTLSGRVDRHVPCEAWQRTEREPDIPATRDLAVPSMEAIQGNSELNYLHVRA